jgi:hypothetical protein
MKINFYSFKFLCAALITAGIALNISSCKKDNTNNNNNGGKGTVAASTNVTEADAAQFAVDAITPTSGGIIDQVNSAASLYKTGPLSCGVQKDTTFIKKSAAGATPTFNLNFGWNYTLNCTGTTPNQVTYNFTGSGNYSESLMSGSHQSNGQFILNGFGSDSAHYTLTAAYTRVGTDTSKVVSTSQYAFSSILNLQSTNIAIDKTSLEIISGSAIVTVVATASNGKKFTYGGVLTFLGNKKATLVVASGKSYDIQWS